MPLHLASFKNVVSNVFLTMLCRSTQDREACASVSRSELSCSIGGTECISRYEEIDPNVLDSIDINFISVCLMKQFSKTVSSHEVSQRPS